MSTVLTDASGTEWSNRCDLCNDRRKVGPYQEFDCPWCAAVYRKYGFFWYPVNDSNRHLFTGKTRMDGEPK